MNAIEALDAARRGLDRERDKETYKNDSRTLAGLEVAVTYLQAQIDLLRIMDGAGRLDRAIEGRAPGEVPGETDDPEQHDIGVEPHQGTPEHPEETREVKTNLFEAVTEPGTPKNKSRHRE